MDADEKDGESIGGEPWGVSPSSRGYTGAAACALRRPDRVGGRLRRTPSVWKPVLEPRRPSPRAGMRSPASLGPAASSASFVDVGRIQT